MILEGQEQARLHLKSNDPVSHEWGPAHMVERPIPEISESTTYISGDPGHRWHGVISRVTLDGSGAVFSGIASALNGEKSTDRRVASFEFRT